MSPDSTPADAPFILSLGLDAATFELLDTLRKRYFPAERNFLRAHLTLFHALPGDAESEAHVRATLESVCAARDPFPVVFPVVRSLGRGVAVTAQSPELLRLHADLVRAFDHWLTPQDRQKFQPHITIQNKVTPEAAKELFAQLSETWEPLTAQAQSVQLWRYKNGPWEKITEFPLRAELDR